jgi:hypothetical protein
MTGRTRKLTVVVAALLALTLAGAAGAVVRYTVFTITPGNFARFSGTNLYCANALANTKQRAFTCSLNASSGSTRYPVRGTYGLTMNEYGLSIQRWTTNKGGVTNIRKFGNPNTPGH